MNMDLYFQKVKLWLIYEGTAYLGFDRCDCLLATFSFQSNHYFVREEVFCKDVNQAPAIGTLPVLDWQEGHWLAWEAVLLE
jgi:hypothetical protein